jgi:hypothetical protein
MVLSLGRTTRLATKANKMTTAHDILSNATDGTAALERSLALPRFEREEMQDWDNGRTWVRFADGSVLCAEGPMADERTSAEFDEVEEAYKTKHA